MNALKSIFAWLGRFLEKARTVMLNLGTAFVLIFFQLRLLEAYLPLAQKLQILAEEFSTLRLKEPSLIKKYLTQIFSLTLKRILQPNKFKQGILLN